MSVLSLLHHLPRHFPQMWTNWTVSLLNDSSLLWSVFSVESSYIDIFLLYAEENVIRICYTIGLHILCNCTAKPVLQQKVIKVQPKPLLLGRTIPDLHTVRCPRICNGQFETLTPTVTLRKKVIVKFCGEVSFKLLNLVMCFLSLVGGLGINY